VFLFLAAFPIVRNHPTMSGGWVYIITNRPDGTLYVGVTSNMLRRAWEHREGLVEGFSNDTG